MPRLLAPRSGAIISLFGLLPLIAACSGTSHVATRAGAIQVVAAENQYGSMAQAIGGTRVQVVSLLTNPNTDPHEFEASPATASSVANARLVIKNGIGYDSWMDKLLSASPRSGRIVLSVGEYLGHRAGDNPHVWYLPSAWTREATAITADLTRIDPAHRAYFARREAAWLRSLSPVYREIARVRALLKETLVIATEPVYGYMLDAFGATSLDYDFQKAVMNGTDPAPRSVAEFEADLKHHHARMLFYNSQVIDPATTTMRQIAGGSQVPVVGVTETQPAQLSFVRWQLDQLQSIRRLWK